MVHFQETNFKSEHEFREMIKMDLDVIEDGLTLLKAEYQTDSGPIDILAVDSEKRLILIELKVDEDKTMLLQALRYYDWIYSNLDRVCTDFPTLINSDLEPKIILVAKNYDINHLRSVKHLSRMIELYKYRILIHKKSNEKGLYCEMLPIAVAEQPREKQKTEKQHIDYITNQKVITTCKKFHQELKSFPEITSSPIKDSISFYYKGYLIARMYPDPNKFWISVKIWDPDGFEWQEINTDMTDYSKSINLIINECQTRDKNESRGE